MRKFTSSIILILYFTAVAQNPAIKRAATITNSAENPFTSKDLTVVNTIADMQKLTLTANANNKLIYVKGYFEPGDDGGGLFIYKHGNEQPTNMGTIFDAKTGRWLRQYSGYMNVAYFGVLRAWEQKGGISVSDRIQNMIDFASANSIYSEQSDVTIYFPNGQYFIDKPLIIKDRVKLLGSPGTLLTNKGDKYDYMFTLDKGPVTHVRMENFHINCNKQKGVGGMHFKAAFTKEGMQHGGLWDAVFKNIFITEASNPGIYLEGGEASQGFNLPHQFIIFENVRVTRINPKEPSLKMTGYNANMTFTNCEFRNADTMPTPAENCIDGACILITSNDMPPTQEGSYAISFINSGFGGYSRYGAVITNSKQITFDTGFYEGMDTAFKILNCKHIQIINNRFANAAGAGSLNESFSHTGNSGSLFEIENSNVTIANNHHDVSQIDYPSLPNQYFIIGNGNDNTIDNQNNTFRIPELGKTKGTLQTIQPVYQTLDVGSKKVVQVTSSSYGTVDISTIYGDIATGETLFIQVSGCKLRFLSSDTGNSGGNLMLNGEGSLTVNDGQSVMFIKVENNFQLVR
ncbi:hypothetical protein FMM05_05080 [Flavobacterium zepuense]|uniref:Rhamnogalacturonase A/B/Epimerase-like pectate lyase domain-containing protein n=1 Tax=Flavobacterium zepuense TaxID=2593302 RepID=A0A552V8F4_9FLAO|nr:glycosyl hydrolase family 28-related protein [Flavobacterium zepuense]TRW26752.1 hypothetical protein FMM05_05080 [Flavobacterium zepuense]